MDHRSVHFVGIKGTGMSAAAQIAKSRGMKVTGSDVDEAFPTDVYLRLAAIEPLRGFSPDNVGNVDLVVASAAYGEDHPEIQEALRKGIRVIRYSGFLRELMQDHYVAGVAGTHGKTTTTSMVAHILSVSGTPAEAVIGSGQAYLGPSSKLLIAECCEYRRHFLDYRLDSAIVTSVEHDHPDYYPSFADYRKAFEEFSAKLPPSGLLIAYGDSAASAGLPVRCAKLRYGALEDNDFVIAGRDSYPGEATAFSIRAGTKDLGRFSLGVYGWHNVLNASAALALALHLDVPLEAARSALRSFPGVPRRFELLGECRGARIYDDYAHHPTAISATLAACREAHSGKQVWVVFQPHTYSRTRAFREGFAQELSLADRVFLVDVFASAREETQEPVPSSEILKRFPPDKVDRASFHGDLEELGELLRESLTDKCALLVMGAGDIYRLGRGLVNESEGGAKHVPQA